jgi:hypothetical protein
MVLTQDWHCKGLAVRRRKQTAGDGPAASKTGEPHRDSPNGVKSLRILPSPVAVNGAPTSQQRAPG